MDIYREKILDHYNNPKTKKRIKDFDCSKREDNPLCGDDIEVFIKLKGNIVSSASFIGDGCAVSIASISMLTEKIKGMRVDDILSLSKEEISQMLNVSLSPSRVKCALLGLKAVKKCLLQIYTKQAKSNKK